MIVTSAPTAVEVRTLVSGWRDQLVRLLERMALAESPSVDPRSQDQIREVICEEFVDRGFRVRRIRGKASGGMLLAAPARRERGLPRQMILGHYDTVWPLGTLDEMPFEHDGDVVRGPGVYDMKGGIAQALLAIDALNHFGIRPQLTRFV